MTLMPQQVLEQLEFARGEVDQPVASIDAPGHETQLQIRDLQPDMPVVLVTGYGATAQPPNGELDLVAGIIGKPFDFDQVTAILVRVCGQAESAVLEPEVVLAD